MKEIYLIKGVLLRKFLRKYFYRKFNFLILGNLAGAGDPKELYKDQNQQLKDMGFINDELNFQVLAKTFGNVDAAVERLLNMMN